MGRLTCIMNHPAHHLLVIALLISFISFMPSGRAQGYYQFDFNADCQKAYEEIISLDLNTGK